MKKNHVITVRVTEEEKNRLVADGDVQNLTVNTLVGKIISKYVRWDSFAKDIGCVFLTRPFLRGLIENIDEKVLQSLATSTCRGALRDATLFMTGEMNLENLLNTLDMWFSASNINFRHITDNQNEKYIIKHDLGKNFSIHLENTINSILNDINYKLIKITVEEQSISFEIEKI